jgi:hypothetical protein
MGNNGSANAKMSLPTNAQMNIPVTHHKYNHMLTSYPGPYNAYTTCKQNPHLANPNDSYYSSRGDCGFNNLNHAKTYCDRTPSCKGISKDIDYDNLFMPITGVPTKGGVTMNGEPNSFWKKV